MSPKLLLPLVDVDVRPGASCGDDCRSASLTLFSEPIVDDRPLEPRNGAGMGMDGVDLAERWDVVESLRMI